jgi:small-conductance mechanosensitive channel
MNARCLDCFVGRCVRARPQAARCWSGVVRSIPGGPPPATPWSTAAARGRVRRCPRENGIRIFFATCGLRESPSLLIGYVIFWGILLAGAAAALSVIGLSSLQKNIDLIVVLVGRALVAVLILAGGLAIAGWLSNLAAHEAEEAGLRGGDLFRRGIFAAVLAVAALLAAAQLGIDISLLVLLAAVLLGTAGLVVALSLGVGLAPLSGNIAAGRYVQGNDIQVGDEISVDGVTGIIENLGYASVTLRSEDGSLLHVPNRVLLEGIVTKKPQRD